MPPHRHPPGVRGGETVPEWGRRPYTPRAVQSKAVTVEQYLAELPPDRRAAIQAVREVILANLDKDYEEGMQYGMIGYSVPHRVFPAGYHCDPTKPLPFAGLASQKNHMSLYLMCNYGGGSDEKWFRAAWAETGKKLDMGKCCVRFKRVEDLALDVIAEAIRCVPAAAYVNRYQQQLAAMRGRGAAVGGGTSRRSTRAGAKARARPKAGAKPARVGAVKKQPGKRRA